jgi:hypothetical protein
MSCPEKASIQIIQFDRKKAKKILDQFQLMFWKVGIFVNLGNSKTLQIDD